MDMIYSTSMWGDGCNKICWKPAKSKGFDVRGYYHSVSPSPSNVMLFPWKLVLQAKVPPSVAILFMVYYFG